jgi:hypothetical protein
MLPPEVLNFIAQKYGNLPISVQEYPIHSVVRFAAAVAAGPPVTYTIDQSSRIGFSYGVNGDMGPAGRAGVLATQADTNIQVAGQTRDQADVMIYGMSCFLQPGSEGMLVGDVWRESDIQIATNSDTTIPAGTLEAYPQPGGLYGSQLSQIRIPAIDEMGGFDGGKGVQQGFASNGNPTAGSFRRFENPIFWAGLSSGPDSNLQIIITPRRVITRSAPLARPAAAGIGVYTPPSAAFVDVRINLHAATIKRRGVNAG